MNVKKYCWGREAVHIDTFTSKRILKNRKKEREVLSLWLSVVVVSDGEGGTASGGKSLREPLLPLTLSLNLSFGFVLPGTLSDNEHKY